MIIRCLYLLLGVNAALKGNCVPSTLFDVGVACVYGTQCKSNFCCPYTRFCMVDSDTAVSMSIVQEKNTAAHYEILKQDVCAPAGMSTTCFQYDDGTASETDYDPSQCNCVSGYLSMYNAETWANCGGSGGGGSTATTTEASGNNELVSVFFTLDVDLTADEMKGVATTLAQNVGADETKATLRKVAARRRRLAGGYKYVIEFGGLTTANKASVKQNAGVANTIMMVVKLSSGKTAVVTEVTTADGPGAGKIAPPASGLATEILVIIIVCSVLFVGVIAFLIYRHMKKNRATTVVAVEVKAATEEEA